MPAPTATRRQGSVVLLSGGIDSAFLLTVLPAEDSRALFVDYGQPSAAMELKAAQAISEIMLWPLQVANVELAGMESMEQCEGACIVPARNLVLISLAVNLAASMDAQSVWIGAAPQDREDYPDCRLEFLLAASDAARAGAGVSVRWALQSRAERVRGLGHFADLCWSCYRAGPEHCGECASCLQ